KRESEQAKTEPERRTESLNNLADNSPLHTGPDCPCHLKTGSPWVREKDKNTYWRYDSHEWSMQRDAHQLSENLLTSPLTRVGEILEHRIRSSCGFIHLVRHSPEPRIFEA